MAEQTVEDLQIKIGSNIKEALSGMNVVQKRLDQLKAQLEKGFAPKMDAMKAAMQSVAMPMEKTAQAVKKSANQIAKEQANLQSKLQIIEEKAQAQIATALLKEEAKRIKAQEIINKQADAQRRLAEVSKAAADSIIQKQNDIAAAVQRATDKMQQQATGGFYKQETVPRTGAKMATSTADLEKFLSGDMSKANFDANMQKMRDSATQMEGAVKQAVENVSESVKNIPTEEITAKMQQFNQTASSAMNNLNAQVEAAKQKLQALLTEYETVASQSGTKSDKAVGLESKIYSQQAALQGLYAKVASEAKRVKAETDRATESTRKYGNEVKTVTAKAGGMFVKLGQIIKRALIIGTLYKAFRALFSFIGNGIKNAIAAPEIENLFRVAMGNMADEAAKFATQFKKSLGVDEYATKQMLGTFQNMTTSMGVGANTAYTMSKSLTILANDMASLYDVPVEQAFENLQSAMTGQGRAVKKYGFIVNETTMKQAAWNAGLVAQGEALSEAQKPIAAYLVLLQQSKNAQGDMARTIGSLQNQLRILKQNMTAAGRAFGEAFLPFIQAVVPWLNAFAVVLQRAGTAMARFSYSLFGMNYDEEKKKQEQIIGGLGGVADAEKEIGDAADAAGKKAKGALGAFDKLNVIQSKAEANAGADVPIGGVEVPGIPGLDIPQGESPFEKMADKILKKLKEIKDKMMDLGLREVLDNFSNFFSALKKQIDQYDFATAIKDALWNGFELAMSLLNAAQRMVFPIAIALDIPGIVYEAINTLSSLFEMLNDAVRAVTPGLEAFVQIGLVPIAEWLGDKIRDGLKFLQEQLAKIGDWFTAHTGDFTAFGEALGNLTNALWEVIKPLLDTAWEVFKGVISGIIDIVLNIADSIIKTLTPAINAISGWIKENTPLLQALTVAVVALFAAWKVTELLAFIQMSGGLVAALKAIATATLGVVAAKIKDKIETVALTLMYAKDFVVSIAKGTVELGKQIAQWAVLLVAKAKDKLETLALNAMYAKDFVVSVAKGTAEMVKQIAQWGISTAAKAADAVAQGVATAATVAWNAAASIATGVTTAFGAAMAFLTSPIGLVVIAIGLLIGAIVLLITHWDDLKAAAEKVMDNIKTNVAAFAITVSTKSKEITEKVKTDFAAFAIAFVAKSKETWETAKTDIFAFFLSIAFKAKEGWDNLMAGAASFLGKFKTKWNQGWSEIGNKFSSVWNSLSSTAGRVIDGIKNAVGRMIDKIKDGINGLKELLGLNESARYSNTPSQMGRMSSPSNASNSGRPLSPYAQAATLNPVRLAHGGILRRDTLMIGGEYAGAASNPEIVSPQNIMYETVVSALAPLAAAIDRSGNKTANKIVKAIYENALEADKDGIFKVVQDKSREYQKMIGAPA